MSDHDDLPLPDFDHLPLGSVQTRIRSLDDDQLGRLIEHEREHAHRVGVLQVLEHRRHELRHGAEPTGGDPAAFKPEAAAPPSSGSPVGPTDGPALNPPAHGDPTNPAQPR